MVFKDKVSDFIDWHLFYSSDNVIYKETQNVKKKWCYVDEI